MEIDIDDLAKVIADYLPNPYALIDAYNGVDQSFDLDAAESDTAEQWREMARAVLDALRAKQ